MNLTTKDFNVGLLGALVAVGLQASALVQSSFGSELEALRAQAELMADARGALESARAAAARAPGVKPREQAPLGGPIEPRKAGTPSGGGDDPESSPDAAAMVVDERSVQGDRTRLVSHYLEKGEAVLEFETPVHIGNIYFGGERPARTTIRLRHKACVPTAKRPTCSAGDSVLTASGSVVVLGETGDLTIGPRRIVIPPAPQGPSAWSWHWIEVDAGGMVGVSLTGSYDFAFRFAVATGPGSTPGASSSGESGPPGK